MPINFVNADINKHAGSRGSNIKVKLRNISININFHGQWKQQKEKIFDIKPIIEYKDINYIHVHFKISNKK